jgi:hypothetical protein
MDNVVSPGHSGAGSNSTQVPRVSSPSQSVDWATSISGPGVSSGSGSVDMDSSISTTYCQCRDEDYLVECLSCGSFFQLGTFCPGC